VDRHHHEARLPPPGPADPHRATDRRVLRNLPRQLSDVITPDRVRRRGEAGRAVPRAAAGMPGWGRPPRSPTAHPSPSRWREPWTPAPATIAGPVVSRGPAPEPGHLQLSRSPTPTSTTGLDHVRPHRSRQVAGPARR